MRQECALCGTEEDPDEFMLVGKKVLCRNCRTCPHGKIHYEIDAADVCYVCVRQLFTYEWFWGPAITDVFDYLSYAQANGLQMSYMRGWTWDEDEAINRVYADRFSPGA